MSWMSRFASTVRSGRLDRDLNDEPRFNIESTEEFVHCGLRPKVAAGSARLAGVSPSQQSQ